MKNVIAVFDIGKTNKKILLFDEKLSLVYQNEQKFQEITDEDGVSCDDANLVESWILGAIESVVKGGEYAIKAINFSTYGATLMYLDANGKRLTPIYNYLKPMPESVMAGFYETYGGVDEFSRNTASPAMGMLNSGLQALWLKKIKPEVFAKVKNVLHFPQYLCAFLTGKVTSEYTSIGCHTAMWDFDKNQYHPWIAKEGIQFPKPGANDVTFDVNLHGQTMKVGVGIHDSSSSLAPYIMGSKEKFILISTGTWCIFMNPFNESPLTADQLRKDTLCYMSVNQKQVKSSRLFMGHIHDVNAKILSDYFKVAADEFKRVKTDEALVSKIVKSNNGKRVFFANEMPSDYIDKTVDLSRFASYSEAYTQLIIDLTNLSLESLNLIVEKNDESKSVYISGGFARNEIYVRLLASWLPGKKVYTSEIDNSSALGAAVVVYEKAFGIAIPNMDLGLKEFKPFAGL